MKYFLIAGEASGDHLGASLMQSLKRQDKQAQFYGVGGELMEAQGLTSLFAFEEITIVGFTAALRNIRKLYRYINMTAQTIDRMEPDCVISIDSPDFAIRVRRRVTKAVTSIHYVAPIVWVGRKKRAREYAQLFDAILTLFPFEPPYFRKHGGRAIFIGHDMFNNQRLCLAQGQDIRSQALKQFSVATHKDNFIVALLPGSRFSELKTLLPIFIATAKIILKHHPQSVFIIPGFQKFAHLIEPHIGDLPIMLITDEDKRFDAMKACDCALAASGTVSMHLALLHIPHIIAYRFGWLNWMIFHLLIKKINLFNLVSGSDIVPEYLQKQCHEVHLAQAILALREGKKRQALLQKVTPMIESFRPPPEYRDKDSIAGIIQSILMEKPKGKKARNHRNHNGE